MQSDLFEIPPPISVSQPPQKLAFLERSRISLRLDHFVLCVIVLMVFYVFIFSFGVEKGKRFAMAELKAERAKRQYVTEELTKRVFEARDASQMGMQPGKLLSAAAPASRIASSENSPKGAAEGTGMISNPPANPAPEKTIVVVPAKYTIQLITYTSSKPAGEKIKMLAEKGKKAFIIPSGKFKQVCVDGFQSKANATETLRQLQSEGIAPHDAYVRPMPQAMI